MMPSAYKTSNLTVGGVVEDRDGVKVIFTGNSYFELHVDDEFAEKKRGAKAAYKRAEAIRTQLDPEYAGPPAENNDDGTAAEEDAPVTEAKPAKSKPSAKPKKSKASKAKKGATPSDDKVVMIGHLEGVQRLIPIDVLEELLADQASRVALLRGSDEVRRLQKRVGATEGRCAPIFLTKKNLEDKSEQPALFDGLFTLAAALNLDMPHVAVVILPSTNVSEVQSQIAAMPRANMQAPEVEEGDELFYRAGR